jgi:predicted amidohydrolase YtcJ
MTDSFILHGIPVYLRAFQGPVEAVGISGGRIAAAGSLADVRAALPPDAAVRELPAGGAVLPAFVDPHQHAWLLAIDPHTDALYRKARDIRGLVDLVAKLAAAHPSGGPNAPWLRYHGYEPLLLAEHRSPTAAELDRVVANKPLHVISRTWHESVVNSAGLDALGIGRTTPDPAGGRIARDGRGNATGVLLEAASFDAERASRRDVSAPDVAARLRAFAARLLSLGITRIGDGAVPANLADTFTAELAAAGVTAHPLLVEDNIHDPALRTGRTAKVLLDGGEYCHLCMTGGQLSSLMASSFRAYFGREGSLARAVGTRAGYPKREADRTWHTGIRTPQEAGFGMLLRQAADAGASLAVHAVGNGAVAALLAARAADAGLAFAIPLRIEHAMVLDPTLIGALAASGLPVVVQPGFIPAVGHELVVAPLPKPMLLMPFRSMAQAGIPLVISSDHPGAGLEPWANVAAAVTRRDGQGLVILPDEALELRTAFDAATRQASLVLGDADAGTLTPGSVADLMWCDRDPFTAAVDGIAATTVLATWAGGRLAFERA